MANVFRRRAKPLDGDQLLDTIGIDAAVLAGNSAAKGVADQGDGEQLQVLQQLCHVENVVDEGRIARRATIPNRRGRAGRAR